MYVLYLSFSLCVYFSSFFPHNIWALIYSILSYELLGTHLMQVTCGVLPYLLKLQITCFYCCKRTLYLISMYFASDVSLKMETVYFQLRLVKVLQWKNHVFV